MPTRRQFLRASGGAAALALAGCAARPPTATYDLDPLAATTLDERAHTQFQGGLRNQGYVDRSIPNEVTVDWRLPVNRGDHTAAKSTPVATPDGDLVICGDTGTVRRVTPEKEVRWTAEVDPTTRGIHGTPAIANGSVYVGAYDGALYAFDLESGRREWRRPLGDAIGSSPVYYNGVVYIAVEYHLPSGSVAAVDAATGALEWMDGRPTNHPHSTIGLSLEAGRLVVGSNDGYCYAWTFPGLERAWTFETDADARRNDIKGPVTIHDGVAIFGSWDGYVYGVDLADGSEVWRFETGDEVMSGPAVGPDGTVYVGSHDYNVYALDAASGDKQWETFVGGYVIGSLTATPNHVLAGSYDRKLYALDRDDGDVAWTTEGEGVATSAALVTDDAVYYAERRSQEGDPGTLYRLVPA
ncbi:PQQ-binding-like beta-propeller repeat protein [Halobacteriales archaeon Cl-PHB]